MLLSIRPVPHYDAAKASTVPRGRAPTNRGARSRMSGTDTSTTKGRTRVGRGRRRYPIAFAVLIVFLAISLVGSAEIAPLIAPRNVLLYSAQHWAGTHLPHPAPRGAGAIAGRVTDDNGEPVGGATVVVSTREGATYQ